MLVTGQESEDDLGTGKQVRSKVNKDIQLLPVSEKTYTNRFARLSAQLSLHVSCSQGNVEETLKKTNLVNANPNTK